MSSLINDYRIQIHVINTNKLLPLMQVPHWVIWRLRMANDGDWHRDFVLHMAVSRTFIANIWVWNTSVDFLIHILVSDLRLWMMLMRLWMLVIALFVHLWRHNEFILILGVFFFNHWISLPTGNRYFFTSKLIKSPRKTERLERTDQHFFSNPLQHFLRLITKARIFSFISFPMLYVGLIMTVC